MESKFKIVCFGFTKFFILALMALLSLSIIYSVTYCDILHTGLISDRSLTEALQESLLFISICIYAYIVKRYHTKGVILVAGFLTCMLIREWDGVFDVLLFHGAWKYVAIPAAVLSCYLAFRSGKDKVIADLACFMQKKAYNILLLGMIVVLIISRIFGMRILLNLFSSISFNQGLKNFLEEGSELFGYLIIFYATLMFLWEYKKLNKN